MDRDRDMCVLRASYACVVDVVEVCRWVGGVVDVPGGGAQPGPAL